MKAVISVIGKDKVGILAMIANECANYNLNVLDVTQTIEKFHHQGGQPGHLCQRCHDVHHQLGGAGHPWLCDSENTSGPRTARCFFRPGHGSAYGDRFDPDHPAHICHLRLVGRCGRRVPGHQIYIVSHAGKPGRQGLHRLGHRWSGQPDGRHHRRGTAGPY